MLSEFQTQKLTHFFNLLDYNKNGKITIEDFVAIAENLCVLWAFKEGSPDYERIMNLCKTSWESFIRFSDDTSASEVQLEHWLKFAEAHIVNGSAEIYDLYVANLVNEIFDYFDLNGDDYISLEEYIDLFMAYHIEIRYSAKAFTKLDLNGDEQLSRKELQTAVGQYFKSDNKEDRGNWMFGFWNTEG